jgi:hypothetical protein
MRTAKQMDVILVRPNRFHLDRKPFRDLGCRLLDNRRHHLIQQRFPIFHREHNMVVDLPRTVRSLSNCFVPLISHTPEGTRKDCPRSKLRGITSSRALVWVTGAYTFLTVCLVGVTAYQSHIAQSALQAQAEPELIMEVVPTSRNGARIVLKNEGTYPVTDVSLDAYVIQFAGSPFNLKLSETYRLNETVGVPWWKIDELKAGEARDQALGELGQDALEGPRYFKPSIERGEVPGIPPGSNVQVLPFIKFRMVARRAVDHKRYEKEVYAVVLEEPKTGKPRFVDPRSLPSLREAVSHLKATDLNGLAP